MPSDDSWDDGRFDPQSRPSPGEGENAWILRNADRLGIDYDALRPQLPFYSPLFGRGQDWYRSNVASKVMGFSVLVRRELSPEEKEALSHHAATECCTRAREPPIAVVAAYALERRGRSAMRFPFWSPKPAALDANIFPGPRLPALRGIYARGAWHATRFSCYFFLAHLTLSGLFTSFAMSIWLANVRSDPRLESLRKNIEQLGRQGRLGRLPGGGLPRQHQQQQQQRADESPPDDSAPADDAEPEDSGGRRAGDSFGRAQAGPWSRPQRFPGSPNSNAQKQQQRQQQQQALPEDIDDGYLFDDASPTAPPERRRNVPTSGASASSWDSLRNRALSGGQGEPRAEGQRDGGQGSPSAGRGDRGDGYTYTSAEEERAYAKEQAKKEFDAMLERERRGEPEGRGRRW